MIVQHKPYRFICIEGNIGSGKTTLAQMLAKDLQSDLLLEQFAENPFLPEFYKDRNRYAFPVEIFFLSERHKQMMTQSASLFNDSLIADYCFYKTALFARQNLDDREFSVFYKLYQQLNFSIPEPDMIIYIHRPIPVLLANIAKRGRSYEVMISAEYLTTISKAYQDYLHTIQQIPVLWIDVHDLDYANNDHIYQKLKSILNLSYAEGIHNIDLTSLI